MGKLWSESSFVFRAEAQVNLHRFAVSWKIFVNGSGCHVFKAIWGKKLKT